MKRNSALPVPSSHLTEWVRRVTTDVTEDGGISRIELVHQVDGEGGEMLQRYRMDEREEDEDPDDLCQEIWDAAVHDASTRPYGSHQRYVACAYRADNQPEPETTHPFVITGRAGMNQFGDTEGPTSRGAQAQEMRHSENLHRMMMMMTESVAGRQAREIDRLERRNEGLQNQANEHIRLRERLADKAHERALALARDTRNAQLVDGVLTSLASLVPIVAAHFMSKGAPIQSSKGALPAAAARDRGIGELIKTLTEEQMAAIFGALRPDQQIAFVEAYKSYRDDFAREDAERPEPLRTQSHPSSPEETTH